MCDGAWASDPAIFAVMQDSLAIPPRPLHMTWQDTAYFSETPDVLFLEEAVPSLFEGHLLRVSGETMSPVPTSDPMGWAFLVLMACLALFTFAQRGGETRPSIMLRAAFDRATANHIHRYGQAGGGIPDMVMMLAGTASMGLFLTALLISHGGEWQGDISGFLMVTGGLMAVWLSVRLLHTALGILFSVPHLVRANTQDRTLLAVSCGLLLVPCSALYFFGPTASASVALMLGCGVIALMYLKEMQRSLVLLWADPAVSAAYIFYYFCALKILPLSAAYRLVTAW